MRGLPKKPSLSILSMDMNPGDRILIRLGDRRHGAKGTRVQTFVEDSFKMRWYIDPVGTSRFALIKPDLNFPILPGPASQAKVLTPRVVKPGVTFPVHIHTEDIWGNTTANIKHLEATISLHQEGTESQEALWTRSLSPPSTGWNVVSLDTTLEGDGDFVVRVVIRDTATNCDIASRSELVSANASIAVPRTIFADLHVHSDDTVGKNSTSYSFSHAQKIAGLDIVGYTANDFNVTKARWDATLNTIRDVNAEGQFVVSPGTEWCGNSAAGGDHNVVFLDDPANTDKPQHKPEFPFDKHGNVARSFEWNEDGPGELQAGAWPLDQVYATYVHAAEKHLLIPHVGGRRANLAWHHPQLERLIEIGSAWGHFEWFFRDAIKRGWKLGVSANSDEHRGRCGGGVPGTAVFGTKGGLTGVLSDNLNWKEVGKALRARRTFATTGERLVGLISALKGSVLQGDEVSLESGRELEIDYAFYGTPCGFSAVEAWDATGRFFHRDLQQEASQSTREARSQLRRKVRVTWGGARLYDRYREAAWQGSILVDGANIERVVPFGGVLDNPEDVAQQLSDTQIIFNTRTSGDYDGVDIYFDKSSELSLSLSVTGTLGGYVKVGDALTGNPHKHQPEFSLHVNQVDSEVIGGKKIHIAGGADLTLSVETLLDVSLPPKVLGSLKVNAERGSSSATKGHRSVYFVGREPGGGKVITSPIFIHNK